MFSQGTIAKLVMLFLLVKLSYLLFSVAVSRQNNLVPEYTFSVQGYEELAMRKDAFWYKKIATLGYPEVPQGDKSHFEQQSSWAFFPAYPVINRWLSEMLSIDYEGAAFITSLLYSIPGVVFFFFFCQHYWQDQEKATFCTLLFMVFPFHFYQSMFLTEAPFFLFLIWSMVAIQAKNNLVLSLVLIPLVLIRPNGLVLLLPIYMYYLEQKAIPYPKFFRFRESYVGVLFFLPAFLVFLAYCYYQYVHTGFYFAFSQAQQGWGKQFMFPLLALFRQGNFNYQATTWYVIFIILLVFFLRKKLPISFHTMILISLILPLMAGSTFSMIRYLSPIFPVTLLYAGLLYGLPSRGWVLFGLFLLHLSSFYLWFADYPIGF